MKNNTGNESSLKQKEARNLLNVFQCDSFAIDSKTRNSFNSKMPNESVSNKSGNRSSDSANSSNPSKIFFIKDMSKANQTSQSKQTNNFTTQENSKESNQNDQNENFVVGPAYQMKAKKTEEKKLTNSTGAIKTHENAKNNNQIDNIFSGFSNKPNLNMNNMQNKIKPSVMDNAFNAINAININFQEGKSNSNNVSNEQPKKEQGETENNEIDFEYLYSLVNKGNEKDMVQEYIEQFNEKSEIPKEVKIEVRESENKPIHKKPKVPKSKHQKPLSGTNINTGSLLTPGVNEKPSQDSNKMKNCMKNNKMNNCMNNINSSINRNFFTGTGSKDNSDSQNSSNSISNSNNQIENLNNTNFFSNYNAKKQLDDTKLNSLKFNLMNKNSTNLLNTQMNNLNNIASNINNLSNIAHLNNQITSQMKTQLKNHIDNKGENSENNPHMTNIELENFYLKTFILNKMNTFMSNSSMGEKLSLYNILCQKEDGVFDNTAISGAILNNNNSNNNNNNCNLGFNSMEKSFQKEVVKYTIENFCKFLKTNGYSIIKASSMDENSEKESNSEPQEIEDILKLQEEGQNEYSTRKENTCPHTDKRHYAKNMCNACYHRQGRVKKAWLCPHTTKTHYARGKCRNCYLNTYHKEYKKKKSTGNDSCSFDAENLDDREKHN